MFEVNCPVCLKIYRVKDNPTGKDVHCPQCKAILSPPPEHETHVEVHASPPEPLKPERIIIVSLLAIGPLFMCISMCCPLAIILAPRTVDQQPAVSTQYEDHNASPTVVPEEMRGEHVRDGNLMTAELPEELRVEHVDDGNEMSAELPQELLQRQRENDDLRPDLGGSE